MQNIYNLNTDAINRLTGIDPTLSPDWQEILEEIIPQLDEESQTIVKNTILSPKGITYSKSTGKFFAKKTRDARSNFTIICFTQQTAHQSCPSFARHL